MKNTLLRKFTVALEVANNVCYVKYFDKSGNNLIDQMSDELYSLFKRSDVTKVEIKRHINLYSKIFMPNMLKEEKFDYIINVITDQFISDSSNLFNTYECPFVIKIDNQLKREFKKEEIMNYFADLYKDSLYLFDVRYYQLEKLYYNLNFELHLINSKLVIKSENELYTNALLKQYSFKEILSNLGIDAEVDFQANLITPKTIDYIDNVYPVDKAIIMEYLVDYYKNSNCLFINDMFLKKIDIDIDDLTEKQSEPKFLILLQHSDKQYFSNFNNSDDRIEKQGNIIILYISENLFRESCGMNNYIILMNDKYNLSLNKLGPDYEDFKFLAKGKNSNINYVKQILNTFFNRSNSFSTLDNLFLYMYTMKVEELNNQLNQFLSSVLKANSFTSHNFNQIGRAVFNFDSLKLMIKLSELGVKLGKKLCLSDENILLLLKELEVFIKSCKNELMLSDYENLYKNFIESYNLNTDYYKDYIEKSLYLMNVKRIILQNEREVSFILDTSALLEEPDILFKYFEERKIVIHSLITKELENNRSSNFNAMRAIRNIKMYKGDSKMKLDYIQGPELSDKENINIKKANEFNCLVDKITREGVLPIIVSNEKYNNSMNRNVFKIKQVSLLFN